MNDTDINTYCKGIEIEPVRNITKSDFINICIELNTKIDYCTFQPEGIGGGGIKFVFNDTHTEKYKSMRLRLDSDWPWISQDVMNEWKDNTDVIVRPEQEETITTFLKSFYDALKWTDDELIIFTNVFSNNGFRRINMNKKERKMLYISKVVEILNNEDYFTLSNFVNSLQQYCKEFTDNSGSTWWTRRCTFPNPIGWDGVEWKLNCYVPWKPTKREPNRTRLEFECWVYNQPFRHDASNSYIEIEDKYVKCNSNQQTRNRFLNLLPSIQNLKSLTPLKRGRALFYKQLAP